MAPRPEYPNIPLVPILKKPTDNWIPRFQYVSHLYVLAVSGGRGLPCRGPSGLNHIGTVRVGFRDDAKGGTYPIAQVGT